MKKVFQPMHLLVMLLVGCSFSFTACSKDDTPPLPKEVTTQTMFGDYTGKMIANSIVPSEAEGEEAPAGITISAKVDKDTVSFKQFPIKDIVLAIIKDEDLTDKIVEAVGDVSYELGYKPTLTEAKDSITLALDPKPLKLSIVLPPAIEGEEEQTLLIEVKVTAGKEAGYAVENANLRFSFAAMEVLLGTEGDMAKLPSFTPTTFNFNLNQSKPKGL